MVKCFCKSCKSKIFEPPSIKNAVSTQIFPFFILLLCLGEFGEATNFFGFSESTDFFFFFNQLGMHLACAEWDIYIVFSHWYIVDIAGHPGVSRNTEHLTAAS